MIDWEDNKKRKAFREALQEVYPSDDELELFVDEELNKNLAAIVKEANLKVKAHALIKWAKSKGLLDEVFEKFKAENPNHAVIEQLEQKAYVSPITHLNEVDWNTLFEQFSPDDLADLIRAFQRGFKEVMGLPFKRAQPNHPHLSELLQIREYLEMYDADEKGPELAVRFVEFAIIELQRTDKTRDLTPFREWCERIMHQFNIPKMSPVKTTSCQAFLLVALELMGADVNVYPELRLTGLDKPIPFDASPTACSINQVAGHISEWIPIAEDALDAYTCEDNEVTLEIFLPCEHLETDISSSWNVLNGRGKEISLGTHRRLLVRSSDRINNRQVKKALELRWQELEACTESTEACSKFHRQQKVLQNNGGLCATLKDTKALGLKLLTLLPQEKDERTDILYEIIEAAIPFALWSSGTDMEDVTSLETQINDLLKSCELTNFADLARQWRMLRSNSESAIPLRLLCDRPDRWPNLPDPLEEDDLLIAS